MKKIILIGLFSLPLICFAQAVNDGNKPVMGYMSLDTAGKSGSYKQPQGKPELKEYSIGDKNSSKSNNTAAPQMGSMDKMPPTNKETEQKPK